MLALKIVIGLVLFGLVEWLILAAIGLELFDMLGGWFVVSYIAFSALCLIYIIGKIIHDHRQQ